MLMGKQLGPRNLSLTSYRAQGTTPPPDPRALARVGLRVARGNVAPPPNTAKRRVLWEGNGGNNPPHNAPTLIMTGWRLSEGRRK